MAIIDKYISELLYEHDCVIIPDFGGFVANYLSAKLNPTQHFFSPPAKKLVFNKNLKNTDGLLAYYIATSEKKTYSEATKLITSGVKDFNEQLSRGEKIEIKKVGVLYLDIQSNIQFEPDQSVNYLLDSFGLNNIQSPPIKREHHHQQVNTHFVDRKPIAKEKAKINVKKYVALAISIPLVLGAAWISFNTKTITKTDYSNLNPFNTTTVFPTDSNNKSVTKTSKEDIISIKERGKNDTIISNTKPVLASETVASKLINEDKNWQNKYHIIGGCFESLTNAQKFSYKLQQNGYHAAIVDQFNSLYRVKYNSYANKEEAMQALAEIRSLNSGAWLLVK